MEKILVPIDGSDYSMKALSRAKEIGTLTKADLTILFVVSDMTNHPYSRDISSIEQLRAEMKAQSVKVVEEAKEALGDYEGKVDTLVRTGNVAYEIIEVSNSGGYDLIVMGSRGLGRFAKTMLGSVSQKVLNNADISVMVVK